MFPLQSFFEYLFAYIVKIVACVCYMDIPADAVSESSLYLYGFCFGVNKGVGCLAFDGLVYL